MNQSTESESERRQIIES